MLVYTFLYQTPVQLETFICLDWKKNILGTKQKMFLFHTSKIEGTILFFWIRFICVAQGNLRIRTFSHWLKKYLH